MNAMQAYDIIYAFHIRIRMYLTLAKLSKLDLVSFRTTCLSVSSVLWMLLEERNTCTFQTSIKQDQKVETILVTI